jgi:hypothetical protein
MQHQTQYNSTSDLGFRKGYKVGLPAMHCAALSSQVEAIRSILKYPIYDPMIQYYHHGTALHLLLKRRSFREELEKFHMTSLFHVLPNSYPYISTKNDFNKLHNDVDKARPFLANEMSSINPSFKEALIFGLLIMIPKNFLLLDPQLMIKLKNGGMTRWLKKW